ncbi:MAG: OmpA family protein [Nitrospirota bacterium]|nr:OmpA family protein [Nitrospirota bacterium]
MVRAYDRNMAVIACSAMLAMVAGCSGKQVTTSVQDQAFMAGSVMAGSGMSDSSMSGSGTGTSGANQDAGQEVRVTDLSMAPPAASSDAMIESSARSARLAAVEAMLADIYFDYNRSGIRKDGLAKLEANARLLRAEQNWKLMITGHCDERGSQDYNLVLGERRAESVKQYLEDLGLPASQIHVASYGKEKPFCSEPNEECWQQNRRAHFSVR